MKLTSTTRYTIKPAAPSPTSGSVIRLSNIDQIVPRFYTRFLLFFCRSLPDETLRQFLSTALTTYNPLAGRYRKLPNGSLELHCTDEGAEFIAAATDSQLKDFQNFEKHDPRFATLSPSAAAAAEGDITQAPLLLVQYTRFSCGGSSLVVALHHNVGDGRALSLFVKFWSHVCSGAPCSSPQPPCFDHSLLAARQDPRTRHLLHREYQTEPPSVPASFPELQACMFKFSNLQLQRLRAGCHTGATRFEVLAGHVWRHVTKARGLQPDQETKLGFSVDGRTRLNPPLPDNYFGNAVFYACAASRIRELVENHTSYAVELVHEAIDQMTDEYMRSALEWIEQQETPLKVFPSFCDAETDLAITSWSRFPLYEADFGCGKPVFVGLPVAAFTGLVIFLPSPTEESSTVLVGLYAEHMKNLIASPDFLLQELEFDKTTMTRM